MEHLILSTCGGLFVGLSTGYLVATAMIRASSKKWQKIVDRYERLLEDVDVGFRETFAEMEQVDG